MLCTNLRTEKDSLKKKMKKKNKKKTIYVIVWMPFDLNHVVHKNLAMGAFLLCTLLWVVVVTSSDRLSVNTVRESEFHRMESKVQILQTEKIISHFRANIRNCVWVHCTNSIALANGIYLFRIAFDQVGPFWNTKVCGKQKHLLDMELKWKTKNVSIFKLVKIKYFRLRCMRRPEIHSTI